MLHWEKRDTYIHTLSSLEMIMQMVEKLWPILPTSCACTLGKKSRAKRCEASHSSPFSLNVEFAVPHKTVVSLIPYTGRYLHRLLFVGCRVLRWTTATCSQAVGLRSGGATLHVPLSLCTSSANRAATHLSTARKQAVKGGGLYTNQALGKVKSGEHSCLTGAYRCDRWCLVVIPQSRVSE